MNWGHKITIVFILFALFVATLVTICVRQDFFLVAPDYYEEELAYQDQIDKMNNFQQLEIKPELNKIDGKVILSFPDNVALVEGEIHFFRPSHGDFDQKFSIELDSNGQQTFSQDQFLSGLWKAKLSWKDSNKSYFNESTIIL
ncbi:FixH family protein [Reichenbachiella ulvae]|uniref:FixH family protein n=1 Tax=Reichenbachiella ulvae TaxID=2980104 RepID=A0ABT3CRZ1_9BACT|nr:FixH family protein [Reichenbachiella ulvae]MCV9386259.1 FixH family protein [Reichenbachiella ulvae]